MAARCAATSSCRRFRASATRCSFVINTGLLRAASSAFFFVNNSSRESGSAFFVDTSGLTSSSIVSSFTSSLLRPGDRSRLMSVRWRSLRSLSLDLDRLRSRRSGEFRLGPPRCRSGERERYLSRFASEVRSGCLSLDRERLRTSRSRFRSLSLLLSTRSRDLDRRCWPPARSLDRDRLFESFAIKNF